ncbi:MULTISPECIES: response regulator [Amycolatopsis]|nr:response regulator [Amycolatopsis sacchari]
MGGAKVESVTNREDAIEALPRVRPTALVSDIRRGDDPQAGFTDLRYLRERGLYDGPVLFYTGQVTPSRLAQAEELGADGVTTDPGDVLEWLAGVAKRE